MAAGPDQLALVTLAPQRDFDRDLVHPGHIFGDILRGRDLDLVVDGTGEGHHALVCGHGQRGIHAIGALQRGDDIVLQLDVPGGPSVSGTPPVGGGHRGRGTGVQDRQFKEIRTSGIGPGIGPAEIGVVIGGSLSVRERNRIGVCDPSGDVSGAEVIGRFP